MNLDKLEEAAAAITSAANNLTKLREAGAPEHAIDEAVNRLADVVDLLEAALEAAPVGETRKPWNGEDF